MKAAPLVHIGVIADTHGLLRDEAIAALADSDFIIHAGDIGDPQILLRLAEIAPLTVVRGNNDADPAYAAVPERAWLNAGAVRIEVLHQLADFELAHAAGIDVVISGHSHKPRSERRDGILFVNPGSAGPRRFKLPISAARLRVRGSEVEVDLIDLMPGA